MIKVNLVPADILAKAHQKQQVLQAAAAGVVVLALLVLVSIGHYYTLEKLKHQYAFDDGRLKKLQIIVQQVEDLEKTEAALKARLSVITSLIKGRTVYPYFMSDLVRAVPGGVQLKSLTASGGGSGAGPLKLSFTATASSNDDIADWLRKMDAFAATTPAGQTRAPGKFSNVELGAVTQSGTDYNFSVTAVYTPSL